VKAEFTDGGIAICATFTAEPLAESLRYWLSQLHIPAELEFAPYNHVVQTLVDAHGIFARNKNGLNVVLVRFEDWERHAAHADKQTRNRELIAALKTTASAGASPILVCICPPSPHALADAGHSALLQQLEQDSILYRTTTIEQPINSATSRIRQRLTQRLERPSRACSLHSGTRRTK
jgi:hypothetical protein